jgi:hypothetical protein
VRPAGRTTKKGVTCSGNPLILLLKIGGGGVHLIAAYITYRIRLSEIQDSKNTVINTVILVELPIKKSMSHN